MKIENVKYKNAEHTVVDATVDSVLYQDLNLFASAAIPTAVLEWINNGGVPGEYVPATVAMWQARVALSQANLLAQAQTAINASNDVAIQTAWEYGNYMNRNSASIIAIGAALNLTEKQIDDLFIAAAALTV